MVDCKVFGVVKSSNRITHQKEADLVQQDDGTHFLSREDLLICSCMVPGFSLVKKRWCLFLVDLIENVALNIDAYDALVLPSNQKQIIRSLVKNHCIEDTAFDDMIKGKGKGLIFILHGEPGVGKTYTAGM